MDIRLKHNTNKSNNFIAQRRSQHNLFEKMVQTLPVLFCLVSRIGSITGF